MTRKEELLEFIDTQLTGFTFLYLYENIIYSPDEAVPDTGMKQTKKIVASIEQTREYIERFSDELVGTYYDEDPVIVEIFNWELVDREVHQFQ